MSDNASPSVSPTDPLKGRLNYIGGSNWSGSKDTLTWKFSVKTSGYYSPIPKKKPKDLLKQGFRLLRMTLAFIRQ